MNGKTANPRRIVDQFLSDIGQPVSEEQSERATADVLDRIRVGNVRDFRAFAVEGAAPQPERSRIWGAIAAAVVVMLAGGILQVLMLRSVHADVVARSVRGEILIAGESGVFPSASRIKAGKAVKAGAAGGAVALLDGSQIDMSPGAELSIVHSGDGLRVRLESGTVLVSAAKQGDGHLYVETRDCVVSVVGTVFAVSTEASGSRVSVLEGEVHVQRGDISQTLLAGQEASTSPKLGPLPADTGNGWVAPERLALLQQPPVAAPQSAPANALGVVRGIVKQASTGVGIPDVTVTLCPAVRATRIAGGTAFSAANPTPSGDAVSLAGPIMKNKTFFFALWDRTPCSTTPNTTDAAGRFQFSSVAPGEYVVRAEREGFFGASTTGIFRYYRGWSGASSAIFNALPGESQSVTVDGQQTLHDVSLSMSRGGVIAGHIRDMDFRLVVNATVRIVARPAQGESGDGETVATATSNDRGEYRVYWLVPGEYRIVVAGVAGRLASETWFPRGATSAEATPVNVAEGEEVSGIDVVLRPAQGDFDFPVRQPALRR